MVPEPRLDHAETLEEMYRTQVRLQRLGPHVPETEPAEPVIRACSGSQTPEPRPPSVALADHEPQLAPVWFGALEIDIAMIVGVLRLQEPQGDPKRTTVHSLQPRWTWRLPIRTGVR